MSLVQINKILESAMNAKKPSCADCRRRVFDTCIIHLMTIDLKNPACDFSLILIVPDSGERRRVSDQGGVI